MPLDYKEKRAFVDELIATVREGILDHSDRWQDDWDGHELRELIAEAFDAQRSPVMTAPRSVRRRRYCEYRRMLSLW